MSDNIFQSPESELVDSPETRRGSPVKAIIIAIVVDMAITFIGSLVLGAIYGFMLASSGVSTEEIAAQLEQANKYSTFSLLATGIGFTATIFAAYLCAKIVNYSEYKYVSIFAVFMVLFSFLMGQGYYNMAELIVLNILSVLSCYLGAWLYTRKK